MRLAGSRYIGRSVIFFLPYPEFPDTSEADCRLPLCKPYDLDTLRCLGRFERDLGAVEYEKLSCGTLYRKIFVFFDYADAECFCRAAESIDKLLPVLLCLVYR